MGFYFDGQQNGVRFGTEANGSGALLHRLHRVFDLVDSPLRRPDRHITVIPIYVSKHGRSKSALLTDCGT